MKGFIRSVAAIGLVAFTINANASQCNGRDRSVTDAAFQAAYSAAGSDLFDYKQIEQDGNSCNFYVYLGSSLGGTVYYVNTQSGSAELSTKGKMDSVSRAAGYAKRKAFAEEYEKEHGASDRAWEAKQREMSRTGNIAGLMGIKNAAPAPKIPSEANEVIRNICTTITQNRLKAGNQDTCFTAFTYQKDGDNFIGRLQMRDSGPVNIRFDLKGNYEEAN